MTMAARINTIIKEEITTLPYIYGVSVIVTSSAKNPRETTLKFVATQLASFLV